MELLRTKHAAALVAVLLTTLATCTGCLALTSPTAYASAIRNDAIIAQSDFEYGFGDIYTMSVGDDYDANDLRWSSSNELVAKAFDGGVVISETAGTTTITATAPDGSFDTCELTITSEGTYNDMFGLQFNASTATLYPGETLQLATAGVSSGTWSSSKAGVATVSQTGLVKAKAAGITTIKLKTHEGLAGTCKVTVVKNKGQYMSTASVYKHTVRATPLCIECDRFYLLLSPGTALDESIVPKLEKVMSTLEKLTGYSFYPKGTEYEDSKFLIYIYKSSYSFASAYDELAEFSCELANFDGDYQPVVHELLHTLQQRNTGSCGVLLSEGFAETYTMQAMEKLWGTGCYDEGWNRYYDLDQFPKLTKSNIKKNLMNPADSHTLSYFFVEYIRDAGGDKVLRNILAEVQSQGASKSPEDAYAIVASELGMTTSTLTSKFYSYFDKCRKAYKTAEKKGTDTVRNVGATYSPHWSNVVSNYVYDGFDLKLKNGKVTVDYSRVLAYGQQVMGLKAASP